MLFPPNFLQATDSKNNLTSNKRIEICSSNTFFFLVAKSGFRKTDKIKPCPFFLPSSKVQNKKKEIKQLLGKVSKVR